MAKQEIIIPDDLNGLGMAELSKLFDSAKFAKLEAFNALQKAEADVERIRNAIATTLGLTSTSVATEEKATRVRRSKQEVEEFLAKLKTDIVNHLKKSKTPQSKGQILEAIGYTPSNQDWIKVMDALKEAGEIDQTGDKATSAYSIA